MRHSACFPKVLTEEKTSELIEDKISKFKDSFNQQLIIMKNDAKIDSESLQELNDSLKKEIEGLHGQIQVLMTKNLLQEQQLVELKQIREKNVKLSETIKQQKKQIFNIEAGRDEMKKTISELELKFQNENNKLLNRIDELENLLKEYAGSVKLSIENGKLGKRFSELVVRQFAICFENKSLKYVLVGHNERQYPLELNNTLQEYCSTAQETQNFGEFKSFYGDEYLNMNTVFGRLKNDPKATAHPLKDVNGRKITMDNVTEHMKVVFQKDSHKNQILSIFEKMRKMMVETFNCQELFDVIYAAETELEIENNDDYNDEEDN